MHHRSAWFVIAGLLLVLAACRGAGSGQALDLDGSWQLESGLNAGAPLPLVAGRPITLVVNGTTVHGSACNIYGGTIAVSGDRVTMSAMSMTEMACDEPMMRAESAYHAALARVARGARTGALLTLTGPGVELRFRLQAAVADAALVGTSWQLSSLISGETVSSTVGEPATVLFSPDGTVSGSTGCRSFTARYAVSGDQVRVTDLITDKRLCTRELTSQDEHVLAVLGGSFGVAISGTSLTVTAADGRGLGYAAQGASRGGSAEAYPTATIANPDPIEPTLPAGTGLSLESPWAP